MEVNVSNVLGTANDDHLADKRISKFVEYLIRLCKCSFSLDTLNHCRRTVFVPSLSNPCLTVTL